jgi:preprotein translocase subunit SecA
LKEIRVFLEKLAGWLGLGGREAIDLLREINSRRDKLAALSDADLRAQPRSAMAEVFALAAAVAERLLGLRMFDVQILGAIALARGEIAEMQTGEGKTLAAVPAIVWFALEKRGVHVLTANDYLARRDAAWMGPIYEWFGLSVGTISQDLTIAERRAAYNRDITYATANEVGFDHLRDGLARDPDELVQRPFAFAVIDEADSILLDEARIPLVIAGGLPEDSALAYRVDAVVAGLRRHAHYTFDEFGRNVRLTDRGIERVEDALECGSLFDPENLAILTAAQDALHAHTLLRRDVDYVVKDGAIEMVDEFKGRIAQNRRWPAGLHSAVEAKEKLRLKTQGRVLGSVTIQSLAALYGKICGMTGTAATQADEFWKVYKLPVRVIPPNRPVIREDLPDAVFASKAARQRALVEEIQRVHAAGRPILVGTASVEESERLSWLLDIANIPHSVLNARNDEAEAEIVRQAGMLGAVTVSTNMAGRGTDILLGGNPPRDRGKVVALGGLYVIGTTRHEARRIDFQLRGRAGRQGDPGSSRFFISLEDDLLVKFGIAENPDIESVQRTAESQNLEIRQMLWKYDVATEFHRREAYAMRRKVLVSPEWSVAEMLPEEQYAALVEAAGAEAVEREGRRIALATIDEVWADYLANEADLRSSLIWTSWSSGDPLHKFLIVERDIYDDFLRSVDEGVSSAFAAARVGTGSIQFENPERLERGATWTYVTTDQPFGLFTERMFKGYLSRKRKKD